MVRTILWIILGQNIDETQKKTLIEHEVNLIVLQSLVFNGLRFYS